jgi:hypothetical protein
MMDDVRRVRQCKKDSSYKVKTDTKRAVAVTPKANRTTKERLISGGGACYFSVVGKLIYLPYLFLHFHYFQGGRSCLHCHRFFSENLNFAGNGAPAELSPRFFKSNFKIPKNGFESLHHAGDLVGCHCEVRQTTTTSFSHLLPIH